MSSAACAGSWGGSLGFTSDYVVRGLSQSAGRIAGSIDLHYHSQERWYAGLFAASVRRSDSQDLGAELSPYIGYGLNWPSGWNLDLNAAHYAYPGDHPRSHYDYDEFTSSLQYRERLFLTLSLSPDTPAESPRGSVSGRPAVAYDVGLRQPLLWGAALEAGLGYYDLHRVVGAGFVYWNAGLGYDIGAVHLNLAYIGTGHSAENLLVSQPATNRWVGSAIWRF